MCHLHVGKVRVFISATTGSDLIILNKMFDSEQRSLPSEQLLRTTPACFPLIRTLTPRVDIKAALEVKKSKIPKNARHCKREPSLLSLAVTKCRPMLCRSKKCHGNHNVLSLLVVQHYSSS
jgi:hypothetical protein